MLQRRTACALEVAARANGVYRLATEIGIQGPSTARQIQELGLIGPVVAESPGNDSETRRSLNIS
jgi:hypothetical protein